ncbi:glycosyltransferase family 2 protein [Neisseria blantyrii]|uniref:glycosyltransferase family 2 protein n=1 Tax=Neisseria blantyrii TaxID=2830647 RepID=UPI0026590941|nr:glycosyltransferase family 2 protein [Neisseria blantyrii]
MYSNDKATSDNLPSISFILPVYNVAPYIPRALESILLQTVRKEIILIDDGSTDGSAEILAKYMHQYPFITVVSSQNRGVAAARNAGLKLATGDFIMFLDPDDELYPIDFGLWARLAQDNGLQAIKGVYLRPPYEEGKNMLRCKPVFQFKEQHNGKISSMQGILMQSLPHHWPLHNMCFMIDRRHLVATGVTYRNGMRFGEDMVFISEFLIAGGKVLEVDIPFFIYHRREGSLTTALPDHRLTDYLHNLLTYLVPLMERQTDSRYAETVRQILLIEFDKIGRIVKNIPELKKEYDSLFMQLPDKKYL